MADRHDKRLVELFREASQLAGDERRVFVEKAREDDAELAANLEGLLEQSGGPLPIEPSRVDPQASVLFARHLERREAGEDANFERLCAEHPELADELRSLDRDWRHVGQVLERLGVSGSIATRLRSRYGSAADVRVNVQDEEARRADFTEEVLARLGERKGSFGRYKLKGEVARGGQGAILGVWDEDLRRSLAMKVVLGKSEGSGDTPRVDSKTLGRFLEEAQVTGQLDHPGIVPVHELGLDGEGQVYFTMKLVKGRDLKAIFDLVHESREGWSQTRALNVLLKVCEAMAYAHSKGVIHRDLKPGNVMVGKFGEVHVMDWGLARVLGTEDKKDIRIQPIATTSELRSVRHDKADDRPDSPLITMEGDVVGTPAYMSPEQARGELDATGPPTDVYAVGAMLYHLLSGRMPYTTPGSHANNYAIWSRVQEGPPKPLEELAPNAQPELIAVCGRAMARDPARRYADMRELADDLRAYLEGRVVKAYRTGALVELAKWTRRNKGLAASLTVAVLSAVAGSSGAAFVQAKGRREARWQSYVANITNTATSLDADNFVDARRRLEACPEEHRGWEWDHLNLRQDQSLLTLDHESVAAAAFDPSDRRVATFSSRGIRTWDVLSGKPLGASQLDLGFSGAFSPAFSHDARRIAFGWKEVTTVHLSESRTKLRVGGTTIGILDVATGGIVTTLGQHDGITCIAFSPDGRLVAAGWNDDTVRIIDSSTGDVICTFREHTDRISSVAFNLDGTRVVSGSRDETVRLWSASTGEPFFTLAGHESSVNSVAIRSDGRRIVSGSRDTIRLWDAEAGVPLSTLETLDAHVNSLAFSPDGRRIAAGCRDRSVRLLDAERGAMLSILAGHEDDVSSVTFSSDGRLIASTSRDDSVRIWDAETRGSAPVLAKYKGFLTSLDFSSNGQYIAAGSDSKVLIFEGTTGDPALILEGPEARITSVAFSPDSRRIASASWDQTVHIWELETGLLLTTLDHESPVQAVAFRPDGSAIASGVLNGKIRIWDAETGFLVRTLDHGASVMSLAFSPDGRLVASSGSSLRVWKAETGVLLDEFGDAGWAMAFSPDGRRIASSTKDDTVRVFDAKADRQAIGLRGHDDLVSCVAFSPDGRRIASGSFDNTIRLWDATTGEALTTLGRHEMGVSGVVFSPNGKRLISASHDGSLRAWETELASARTMWSAAAKRKEVDGLLESLFEQHLLSGAVIEALEQDTALDAGQREAAVLSAKLMGPTAQSLNSESWEAVKRSDAALEEYEHAVRLARAASESEPDNPHFLNTLGVAEYRVGLHAQALETLKRADGLNRASAAPYNRANDLVFVAMSLHRLRRAAEALAVLEEARGLAMDAPEPDLRALFREAEGLIEEGEKE